MKPFEGYDQVISWLGVHTVRFGNLLVLYTVNKYKPVPTVKMHTTGLGKDTDWANAYFLLGMLCSELGLNQKTPAQ